MIALDARVVIAHLHPDDQHHRRATALLRESATEELTIHSLNLAEVHVGGVRAGRGLEMLGDLEAVGIQVAERRVGEPLRLAALRAESGLKLPDCCALDTALVTASALATFDVTLAAVARRYNVTVAN